MAATLTTAVLSSSALPMPRRLAAAAVLSPYAPSCSMGSQKHTYYGTRRRGQLARPASTSSTSGSSSRAIHSSQTRPSGSAEHLVVEGSGALPSTQATPLPDAAKQAPLSILPLSKIVRSLFTTTVSSSPLLLPPSLAIMTMLANSTSPILNPDKNPLLRVLIKKTFYVQFCAGETPKEVRQTMHELKNIGFSGVILGYAKEVVLTDGQTKTLGSSNEGETAEECVKTEIIPWAEGTLETVRLAEPGDFVALKFTGAGRQALYSLAQRLPPSPAMAKAMDEICQLAASRGVRLLIDAEQQALQAGIDDWALDYMRRYNTPEKATVYNTFQAYLKATPAVLSSQIHVAQKEGFTIGVKLVRGAYLGSDPRHLIHDTKADTDACYDGIAEALLRRQWAGPLAPHSEGAAALPNINMVLASHNAETVRKARVILEAGDQGTEVAFGQLQGMADEVSCELVCSGREAPTTRDGAADVLGQEGRAAAPAAEKGNGAEFHPKAYKYLVWGTTGECMKYLLRRAQENRDAVQRTKSGRDAMRAELWRRVKASVGLA